MKTRKLERPPVEFGDVLLRPKKKHRVRHRVLDRITPELTRWIAQRCVQGASNQGVGGLLGYTDECARRRGWHEFDIVGDRRVRRFLAGMAPLMRRNAVAIEIDGFSLEITPRASDDRRRWPGRAEHVAYKSRETAKQAARGR